MSLHSSPRSHLKVFQNWLSPGLIRTRRFKYDGGEPPKDKIDFKQPPQLIGLILFAEVIRSLEEEGKVTTPTPEAGRELLNLPLKCHKCSFESPNIPKLKMHLKCHLKAQDTS